MRDALVGARRSQGTRFAGIARVTAADTIYAIDHLSERVVLAWFERHWPADEAVELVMEGLEERGAVTFPRGTPVARTKWKLLLDPIDGTRGLMHDKRSGWTLAGLAPQRGATTKLNDIVVAAMTELPTSKAGFADQLSAVRGAGVRAERIDLRTRTRRRFRPQASRATTLAHGFASFAKFLPEGKAWLAEREETLWRELGLSGASGGEPVFDDQYISTGGQLYELIVGHDRFIADVRPLAFAAVGLGEAASLPCHPYDLAAALVATEAGCVVTDAHGRTLRAPLDTTTPVAWVGFANKTLARRIAPKLRRVLGG